VGPGVCFKSTEEREAASAHHNITTSQHHNITTSQQHNISSNNIEQQLQQDATFNLIWAA